MHIAYPVKAYAARGKTHLGCHITLLRFLSPW